MKIILAFLFMPLYTFSQTVVDALELQYKTSSYSLKTPKEIKSNELTLYLSNNFIFVKSPDQSFIFERKKEYYAYTDFTNGIKAKKIKMSRNIFQNISSKTSKIGDIVTYKLQSKLGVYEYKILQHRKLTKEMIDLINNYNDFLYGPNSSDGITTFYSERLNAGSIFEMRLSKVKSTGLNELVKSIKSMHSTSSLKIIDCDIITDCNFEK